MTIDIRAYGRGALLAEPTDRADLLPLAAAARSVPGVVEVVPAARTVLVVCHDPADSGRVARQLSALDLTGARGVEPGSGAREIVLDVVYDGADLDAIAAETGLARDEVIGRHARGEYVVAFCGFAPGFAYLTGLDGQLHVPRLPEPRTRVPAGAVGIAGEFTGVYPRPSPGGWRLVGHTSATLWDVDRETPALLVPGDHVRFRPA